VAKKLAMTRAEAKAKAEAKTVAKLAGNQQLKECLERMELAVKANGLKLADDGRDVVSNPGTQRTFETLSGFWPNCSATVPRAAESVGQISAVLARLQSKKAVGKGHVEDAISLVARYCRADRTKGDWCPVNTANARRAQRIMD
jgi:hypothetical protein